MTNRRLSWPKKRGRFRFPGKRILRTETAGIHGFVSDNDEGRRRILASIEGADNNYESHNEIYFDNSATTKVLDSVKDIVVKTMTEDYGNPSARHRKGKEAEDYVKESAEIILGL